MVDVMLKEIFAKVEKSTLCHPEYTMLMCTIYKSEPFECFFSEFFKIILNLLHQQIGENILQVYNSFTFSATFLSHLIDETPRDDEGNCDVSHPLLRRLIQELLKYHDLDKVEVRFHTCRFIGMLFLNIRDPENAVLEEDLYYDIQNTMLKRITDSKPYIRMQAVSALRGLQNKEYNDCPTIKAFKVALEDPSSMVRKAVIDNIVCCPLTYSEIAQCILDSNSMVRSSAFAKLTLIKPEVFKIIDCQVIVLTGTNEQNKTARNSFVKMLIKWLSIYECDYIKLLNVLKLDANEENFERTIFIWEKVLDVFLTLKPINEMITILQLDHNNLVTSDRLCIEVLMFWYYLLSYFKSTKNMYEYYEMIRPKPMPLFYFIAGYVKKKTSSKLSDWEYLEFQWILNKLFQITRKIDLADKISKNALHTLTIKTMTETKLDDFVLSELIDILKKIFPNLEELSKKIFSVVAVIRKPLVEWGPGPYLMRERDFQFAQICVVLHILDSEIQKLDKKHNRSRTIAKATHTQLKKKLEDFMVNPRVRMVRNCLNITHRCLNIVTALLQNINMKTLLLSITPLNRVFVKPVTEEAVAEFNYKILKFYTLCTFSDKQLTFNKIRMLFSPIIAYRLTFMYDKATLLLSMKVFLNLLRDYGPNIINLNSSTETILYDRTQSEISDEINLRDISGRMIVNIILDIMNDEVQDLRECATQVICNLVERGIFVSSSLIIRLLLKIINPLREKEEKKYQQRLTFTLIGYAWKIKGSAKILEEAVLETLYTIGKATKTSPLFKINIEFVLSLLASLTRTRRTEFFDSHVKLTYSIFDIILNNPEDKCNYILSVMLQHLDDPDTNQIVIDELYKLTKKCLEVVKDEQVIENLSKYRQRSVFGGTGVSFVTRASIEVYPNNPRH